VAGNHTLPDDAVELPPEAKVPLVHDLLCEVYECPIAYFHSLDPLSELVSSLLSHRTRNRDSGAAFKSLRSRFATWEEVRDAPLNEVQNAILTVTWPEQKAPRIQQALRLITERRGRLELDFLAEMSIEEARTWLEALPGVGPKTSAAVLSFSDLRGRALPVDSHHYRVALRLGLVLPTVDVGSAHRVLESQLPPEWDAQRVYDNHEVMMLHGQRCCYHQSPNCHRCAVLPLCPYGQTRLAARKAAPQAELF
jgi:endonuclease-3